VVSEESPYKPPQEEEVPVSSKVGLVVRVALAFLGVVGLSVAFLTRGIWIGWLTDEPMVATIAGVVGAGIMMTWLRRPITFRRKPAAPPRRLRNRHRL
jgi:hypothetical protein